MSTDLKNNLQRDIDTLIQLDPSKDSLELASDKMTLKKTNKRSWFRNFIGRVVHTISCHYFSRNAGLDEAAKKILNDINEFFGHSQKLDPEISEKLKTSLATLEAIMKGNGGSQKLKDSISKVQKVSLNKINEINLKAGQQLIDTSKTFTPTAPEIHKATEPVEDKTQVIKHLGEQTLNAQEKNKLDELLIQLNDNGMILSDTLRPVANQLFAKNPPSLNDIDKNYLYNEAFWTLLKSVDLILRLYF